MALFSAFVQVVSLVLFTTIPESPVWLISKGRLEDAQKALGWLRGFLKPQDVQKEFDELVRYTKRSQTLSNTSDESKDEEVLLNSKSKHLEEASEGWLKAKYNELKNPKLYLPLRFILISIFFGQAVTLGPFSSYLFRTLQQFWFPVDQKWILTMSGAIPLLASMIPMFIITRTGKRGLAIPCMSIAAVCLVTLGLFASFFTHTEDLVWSWLLIVDLAVYFLVTSLGTMNVYYMLFCEIFPVRGKGLATSLSTIWACFLGFTLEKSYLYVRGLIGLSGIFYFYGFITLLGCVYFYFCMPETEGKTIERIETYYTPNHDRKEKFRMPRRSPSKA